MTEMRTRDLCIQSRTTFSTLIFYLFKCNCHLHNNINKYTSKSAMNRKKRTLVDKINHLGPTEHMEILKLLKEHGALYTENANGVFFNLTTLEQSAFDKIDEFVEYCCDNKRELDEYDQKLQECKYYSTKPRILLPNNIREPVSKSDCLKDVMEVVDKPETIQDFVQKLHNTGERVSTKKINSKFALARKRFLKRSPDPSDILLDDL